MPSRPSMARSDGLMGVGPTHYAALGPSAPSIQTSRWPPVERRSESRSSATPHRTPTRRSRRRRPRSISSPLPLGKRPPPLPRPSVASIRPVGSLICAVSGRICPARWKIPSISGSPTSAAGRRARIYGPFRNQRRRSVGRPWLRAVAPVCFRFFGGRCGLDSSEKGVDPSGIVVFDG